MDMSARKPAVRSVVDPDRQRSVHVDCYVRSTVPTAVSDRISTLVDRLETLRDRGYVDTVGVNRWPAQHVIADEARTTRDELVAEFERWADRHGYSLEPGFRRRRTPPSPLGVDAEPREQVRVPMVGLAVYEDDTDADADVLQRDDTDADADVLRGVLPCTELSYTGDERTVTVDEWLAAVEARAFDEPVRTSQIDGRPLLEGR